jgi:hypothetical protein
MVNKKRRAPRPGTRLNFIIANLNLLSTSRIINNYPQVK